MSVLLLCVDYRDYGQVDDVLDLVAALKDVYRFVHPHHHRPDHVRIAKPLWELVADIAGLEVREDEDVRRVVQLGELVCSREHFFDDGGVSLHLTVDGKSTVGSSRSRWACRR